MYSEFFGEEFNKPIEIFRFELYQTSSSKLSNNPVITVISLHVSKETSICLSAVCESFLVRC